MFFGKMYISGLSGWIHFTVRIFANSNSFLTINTCVMWAQLEVLKMTVRCRLGFILLARLYDKSASKNMFSVSSLLPKLFILKEIIDKEGKNLDHYY